MLDAASAGYTKSVLISTFQTDSLKLVLDGTLWRVAAASGLCIAIMVMMMMMMMFIFLSFSQALVCTDCR